MKYYICLLLQVIPFLLASCGSDDGVEAPPYGDDYVENAFRFEGELFLTSYWSMEREHPALYGIEVLSSDGTPYAYGLFDDPNKAIVKLPEGERFVYRAMVVPDGQTLCKSSSSGFEDIFLITSDGETCRGCELRNEFVYSKSWHFYHFRIPKQSFYYRIFYGCGAGSDCLQGGVVEMETYSIWSLVYVLSKPELTSGRIEYRLMSDVGIPLQYTWDEMTTPIFVLTPNPESPIYLFLQMLE